MTFHHVARAAQPARTHASTARGLRYHSLVEPPLVRSPTDEPTGRMTGVWTDDGEEASGAVTTRRRLAIQSLQLRAARLGGADAALTNPSLRLLAEDQLNHLYLAHADFVLLAGATGTAGDAFGEPPRLPAFVAFGAALLVIDASRFFEPGSAALTPAAYDAFAAMVTSRELPALLRATLQGLAFADDVEPTRAVLQGALNGVLCQALGKPRSAEVARANRAFVAKVGLDRAMGATLGGSRADVEAVCAAFLGLRSV